MISRLSHTAKRRGMHRRTDVKTMVGVTIAGFIFILCLYSSLWSTKPPTKARPSAYEIIAMARLVELQAGETPEQILRSTGLMTGSFAWDDYVNDISRVHKKYFEPYSSGRLTNRRHERRKQLDEHSNATDKIDRVGARLADSLNLLSLGRNISATGGFDAETPQDIPRVVHTTSTGMLPKRFASWEMLNSKAGWQVHSYNSEGVSHWMTDFFGRRESRGRHAQRQTATSSIMDLYEQIPSGISQDNVFRYLTLLVEGGVFTDDDTSCLLPLSQWPGLMEDEPGVLKDLTDSMLLSLPYMADLVNRTEGGVETNAAPVGNQHLFATGVTTSDTVQKRVSKLSDAAYERPKLVIGIEYDNWDSSAKEEWTAKEHGRGMRISQSTVVAQPGHPVFIDVIGRIFGEIQNAPAARADYVAETEKGRFANMDGRSDHNLDLTGPEVLSDAIFRYLLARWGVHPKDFTREDKIVRAGDVLIYPLKTFTSTERDVSLAKHHLVSRRIRRRAPQHPSIGSAANQNDQKLTISPSTLDNMAQSRLQRLQSSYRAEEVQKDIGLKLGRASWIEYAEGLQDVYERFFMPVETPMKNGSQPDRKEATSSSSGTLVQEIWGRIAESLKVATRDTSRRYSNTIPKIIHTTAKEPIFADQFSTWRELNLKDGWDVQYYSDDGIWEWMVEIFGQGAQDGIVTDASHQGARILREYGQLHTGVLKADFFRYLVMLMEGGVYSDTDTACVRPLKDWPGVTRDHPDVQDKTDPLLSLLPNIYDFLSGTTPQTEEQDADTARRNHESSRIRTLEEFDPPKLIVSVEAEHFDIPGTQL